MYKLTLFGYTRRPHSLPYFVRPSPKRNSIWISSHSLDEQWFFSIEALSDLDNELNICRRSFVTFSQVLAEKGFGHPCLFHYY
ncbi:hypothetical protein L596_008769 [Steinernema carpocapsae]|uniref:Uncharacterized protein n=1 Tax=Steinernema carpocapsae TaxID=34508 RepID=A0A4U5PDZ3_STECR|nr:hypothetical protein L596_008769 [Steinernema carpocapsae]